MVLKIDKNSPYYLSQIKHGVSVKAEESKTGKIIGLSINTIRYKPKEENEYEAQKDDFAYWINDEQEHPKMMKIVKMLGCVADKKNLFVEYGVDKVTFIYFHYVFIISIFIIVYFSQVSYGTSHSYSNSTI